MKMYFCFLLLWNFINEMNAQDIFSSRTNKVLHFDKFLDDCPDVFSKYERIATQYRNVSMTTTKSGSLSIDYRIRVLEDLPLLMTLKLLIQRCASKEAPDTCVRFSTFSTDKMCVFLASKTDAWTTFISCIKPTMICPIHKGNYIGLNCTFNVKRFNMFPTGNSYWKIRGELYTKKEKMIGCVINEGFMKNVF